MRKKAFTLLEMIIYMGLFSLAGMLVATIFFYMNQTQRATTATFAVTGEADTAIQTVRRDLEETALGSIRLDPNPGGPKQPGDTTPTLTSGVSFCAARIASGSDEGKLWLSEYGVPRWTKNVFYAVRQTGDEPLELVRWEIPLASTVDNRIPQIATIFPKIVSPMTQRVILHNIVKPNGVIQDVPDFHASEWGGFDVGFLRRKTGRGEDYKVYKNPNQEATAAGQLESTQLVDTRLAISQNQTGKTEFYSISFRVMPRY